VAPHAAPFELHIEESALRDLRERLARVRFPDEAPASAWSYGTSVDFMRDFVAYWTHGYDWRATERALNRLPQFKTRIEGIDVHFIHVEGRGPKPIPLLLSHGWPGSVLEFMKLIPLLTDPAAHGGDTADAFTIVAPSLPGYTLSFAPNQRRFAVPDIGATFDALMLRLGYGRYGAQGGDWGSFVTAWLGANRADHLTGIHLNLLPLRRDAAMFGNPDADERRYLRELEAFLKEETGYQWIQGTRPQTLAFALADSPIGLAAWFVEKYRAWTDCDGDPRNALTLDEMLGNICLYWFTHCIGASFWPYYARMHGPWPIDGRIDVPTGYVEFPHEILRPPRVSAERVFNNIRRWSVMPQGGHFAALEQPQALASEVRAFFRELRGSIVARPKEDT
jgi:pimeloyl-ACP methyl ester carboxylesterase